MVDRTRSTCVILNPYRYRRPAYVDTILGVDRCGWEALEKMNHEETESYELSCNSMRLLLTGRQEAGRNSCRQHLHTMVPWLAVMWKLLLLLPLAAQRGQVPARTIYTECC